MKLICKEEARNAGCFKVMEFTKGVIYNFKKVKDPEGWQVVDDNGKPEVFFNTDIMFEKPMKQPKTQSIHHRPPNPA